MLNKEIKLFLIIGVSATFLDFLIYSLVFYVAEHLNFAKTLGFICGTIFTFFGNRKFTFGHIRHRNGSILRHFFLYLNSLILNVTINNQVLLLDAYFEYVFFIAFIIATAASTILNFIGMKFFVFIK